MAKRQPSKTTRWYDACRRARAALEELEELREGFGDTYENMTEGLQQTSFGIKCEAMKDFDLQPAIEAIDEAEGLEIPLGFGRD